MGGKLVKRCSVSLIIREKEIKATGSYHLTLMRIALIKKKNNNSHFGQGWGETETLVHLVGMYNGTDAVENILAVLQKLRITTRSKTSEYFPKVVKRGSPTATLTCEVGHKEN